jgi:tetratricopeptide (TPR) repeat protein
MYYTMGEVLADRGSYPEAEKNYKLALDANVNPQDKDLHGNILRSLIICAGSLNKLAEAERWFQGLVAIGKASWWDWSGEGDRLYSQATYDGAETAYQKSADAGGGFRQWCLTALAASIIDHDDVVLSAGRKCIEEGAGQKDSDLILAGAHEELAEALNRRGVYTEALTQARESLTMKGDNPFAYDQMADALFGLRRFQEVVNAAQQAIRLSDGKYAWMHFRLASAYFELQNWEFARQSFQKSAELNPKMFASIYNVALCYSKLGYYRDAITWYEEYLRQNPNARDRSDVEATIKTLKSL